MAIFPNTDLALEWICYQLGYIQSSLGHLCISDRVNKHSRYRPGYWIQSGGVLTFQKPRGEGYIDPRGVRFDSSYEAFAEGDFRGYNPDAITPSYEGSTSVDINISSSQTGTISIDSIFYLGEVDWFNEEGGYRGKNWFGSGITYTQLHAVLVEGSSKTVVGTVERSALTQQGRNLTALHLVYELPIKTTSNTVTYNVQFALGRNGRAEAFFPGIQRIYNVTRSSKPTYLIQVLGADYSALKTAIYGLDPTDESASTFVLTVDNSTGSVTSAATSVYVTNVQFYLLFPNGNRYRISGLRWGVAGDLEVYDRGTEQVVSSSRASVNMALGTSGYNFTLTLPEAAKDNRLYRFNLDTFDSVLATKE